MCKVASRVGWSLRSAIAEVADLDFGVFGGWTRLDC